MEKPLPTDEALSSRELEIAQAYSSGETYQQIADRLFLAPSTVRTHLSTVYRKLGVSSKLQLHRYFEDRLQSDNVEDTLATPLPDKPSIAVLAFENMSQDPQQEHFFRRHERRHNYRSLPISMALYHRSQYDFHLQG